MKKSSLLLLPILVGLILFVLSWWQTYPVYVSTVNGFQFDRISSFYWISLPILLASVFLITVTVKNDSMKLIATISLVLFMYSLPYFYNATPGSDSHAFRGLVEYFIKTGDLNPSVPGHLYFEFPSFFLLGKMAVEITGVALSTFEFILYTVMGFLMAATICKYFSSRFKKGSFVAVAAFFISMFNFLNYQYAPFSLAFALLLVSLMLESRMAETREKLVLITILFTGIVFTHPFIPLFFIVCELIIYFLDRKSQHLKLFLLTTTIYLMFQIYQAPLTFTGVVDALLHSGSEYLSVAQSVLAPASVSIDQIAQTISRSMSIAAVLVVVLSFVYLLARRRGLLSRPVDKAILASGVLYSLLGTFIQILGSRAIPLAFVPVSLGVAYLFENKFRVYIVAILLIFLVLFFSLPMHGSFYDSQTFYQTQEAYRAENFMIEEYNWTHSSFVLAHTRVVNYLMARNPSNATYESDFSSLFPRLQDYDCILYTIGLGKSLLRHNSSIEAIIQQDQELFNLAYDNGFSRMTIKSYNLTWAIAR